jgi:hypothetical protein
MARSPLALFILDRLRDRGEAPDHFAQRIGVNGSGLNRFLRGKTMTLHDRTKDKVALGLGMTANQMMALAGGDEAYEHDPQHAEVLARVPELAEIIRGLPPELWGRVLRYSVHSARELAHGLVVVGCGDEDTTLRDGQVSTSKRGANRGRRKSEEEITPLYSAVA